MVSLVILWMIELRRASDFWLFLLMMAGSVLLVCSLVRMCSASIVRAWIVRASCQNVKLVAVRVGSGEMSFAIVLLCLVVSVGMCIGFCESFVVVELGC